MNKGWNFPAFIHLCFSKIISPFHSFFHEKLLGGIPTLFIPNEAFEMDRQLLRAKHVSLIGYAEILRANDLIDIKEQLPNFI